MTVAGTSMKSTVKKWDIPKIVTIVYRITQPDCYYYWDSPLEEDYDWRDAAPHVDCMCEICFDILNHEGKIKWKEKNPFELMLDPVND